MSVPTHPLLALVDAHKNVLKASLTNYIEVQVEMQFGQLKNRIVHMIEDGEIVSNLGDVNAPVSTQTNTNQANSTDDEDSENVVDSAGCQPNLQQHTKVSVSSLVQPSTLNHQNPPSNASITPSTMINSNEHLPTDQITSPPIPPAQPIITSPLIKQEYLDTNEGLNANAPIDEFDDVKQEYEEVKEEYDDDVKEEYDDDCDDEGEYMSDCDECEDCAKGICQSNQPRLVGENDNADNDAETEVDPQIGLNQDEVEDQPNGSVIDHDHNEHDYSLLNEQQVHNAQKSVQMSMHEPSSSGLSRSEETNQIETKVFGDDQSNGQVKSEKRKIQTESTNKAAAKRIKPTNDGAHFEEGKCDEKIVTLELNCTKPDCTTILSSLQMWKLHLSSVHGQMPHKQNNARLNHLGYTEYCCIECQTVSTKQSSIYDHWIMCHHEGKFKCGDCEFVANFRHEVDKHRRNDHKMDPLSAVQNAPDPIDDFDDDEEDNENVVDSESHQINSQHAQVSASASFQPAPSKHQNVPSNASTAQSTMNNSNEHLPANQITSLPTPSAHPIATKCYSLENSSTSREVSTPGPMTKSKRTRVSSQLDRPEIVEEVSAAVGVDLSEVEDPNVGGGLEQIDDHETELAEEEGGHYKIKIVKLKCTEVNCEEEVASRGELNGHLRDKHHTSPYRCLAEGCFERFEQWNELGPHVQDNHSNISIWSCDHCTKTFNTHHLLYNHLYWHHFEGQFKCGYDGCDYDQVATLRSEIKAHQSSVHPQTTIFTCLFNNCGKTFNHKGNFVVHQRSHTGVKPFPCGWIGCDKSFTQKQHLINHRHIHQGVKPFKCTWNMCGYAAAQQSTVIKHIRTKHFHLPATLKAQQQLGIEENRNPSDFLLVEHVNPPM